ncbi:unnamed protein product [Albugo candida]|uniref:Uncharacterized protein n=1 Tax=Albugo candida TaxID=65357 RepID=A0A024GPA4_9STRA|nr:unnamed protein product [Albugo candida]|eukprot:CCI48555.1 unnamed protein product [Albugo candida]
MRGLVGLDVRYLAFSTCRHLIKCFSTCHSAAAILLRVTVAVVKHLKGWIEYSESFLHITKSLAVKEPIRVASESLFLTMLEEFSTICSVIPPYPQYGDISLFLL